MTKRLVPHFVGVLPRGVTSNTSENLHDRHVCGCSNDCNVPTDGARVVTDRVPPWSIYTQELELEGDESQRMNRRRTTTTSTGGFFGTDLGTTCTRDPPHPRVRMSRPHECYGHGTSTSKGLGPIRPRHQTRTPLVSPVVPRGPGVAPDETPGPTSVSTTASDTIVSETLPQAHGKGLPTKVLSDLGPRTRLLTFVVDRVH